jgi:hypothetical protein
MSALVPKMTEYGTVWLTHRCPHLLTINRVRLRHVERDDSIAVARQHKFRLDIGITPPILEEFELHGCYADVRPFFIDGQMEL